MARGVNKVILVGNLGADPETRYTQGGTAVTEIRVATSEQWKDKQTGERQERTEWHRCTLWGRLAEIAGEYLKKGRQVYLEGSLRTEKYTDRDGIERYATKITVNEMQLLGGGGEREAGAQERPTPARPQGTSSRPAQPAPRQSAPASTAGDFEDDDIPF